MGSSRPPSAAEDQAALADTMRADFGFDDQDASDSSSFELATGEPSLIPVSIELPPTTQPVERYEPITLLGAGGMGEVRLLKDTRIGRHIALKKLHKHMQDTPTI